MRAADIEGGFASPVLDSQATFNAVMRAMAEPGTIQAVDREVSPPAALNPAAAAVALSLCDQETLVWLDAGLANTKGIDVWLSFHSGATVTSDPAQAQFLVVADPAKLPAFGSLAQGTQEYPDRSTTIILQVVSLDSGHQLTLSGPGIKGETPLSPQPMPDEFVRQWSENNAQFPCGVDLILAAPDAIACLPRTTRIHVQEG
ncbi:phosphonate C-P lyase system protein PhnH [Aquamicrobium zhengzhouense]|uniref:Phosphonate C-P lyase system protein PhnH n=1 Tax=Aquamicrobium zhengzhouense TaxID=2781738 RepID=A0ABS0SDN5_9HYPH|nr:phosphonate C-P lyase system protein PhnH [Aquamicrobium zhengzhouense]MBI1621382.1 phosphonate C-P lyase system protein PhnH [Aquamicrobium zhengzhouense]